MSLIHELLTGFQLLREEGYQIEFKRGEDVKVMGDSLRIKQVILNLMNNAVSYGGNKKEITVSLSETDSGVLCSISDSGPGIPAEELEYIWQRYYRVSNNAGRSPSGGSGLGLSIVKEILTLHGAEYGVASQLGIGTTFWFQLPK